MTRYLAAAIAALALTTSPAACEGVDDFYRNKTITILNGFGPGGSNDIWARSLARHMGKHMPGNPHFVTKNMPGAGTLRLTNHLGAAAAPDGTTFGVISKGVPLEPLFGGPGLLFDPLSLTWIGSPDRDTNVCVARKDSTVQKMQDLLSSELIVGATGSGADTAIYPEFISDLLGLKIKTIRGFPGSTDVMLAVERRELDGICVSYVSIARHRLNLEGAVNILFQSGFVRDTAIPANVPMIIDMAKTPAQNSALRLFVSRAALGRPFVAPPGVPADRVRALRQGFEAAMKDPEFVKEVEKQGLVVEPITGEGLGKMMAEIYKTPKDVVSSVTTILARRPK